MAIKQEERLIQVEGPFDGADVVGVSFSASEAISRLFSFQLEFLCGQLDLTGKDVIGKAITVQLLRFDDEGKVIGSRYFNGYINKLRGGELYTDQSEELRYYNVEIVPWLWFLTQSSNCHIFFPEQKTKTIEEVIKSVFDRAYHVTPKFDISAKTLSREVERCVQYRETDFNFISRILEQYGVYYYFEHEDGEHKMILADVANYPPCEESSVDYYKQSLLIKDNCVTSWEHQFEFVSGNYAQTDYDFTKALEDLKVKSSKITSDVPSEIQSYEIYDYPGEYDQVADGSKEARTRQEEEEVSHNRVSGSSTCKTFCAGFKFDLIRHPDEEIKSQELGEYLITTIQHRANQPYDQVGSHASYGNDFSCIPAKNMFRPARITPKPIISGVQTAVVTGPPDQEIYTDDYGRIKVWFRWDRETAEIKSDKGQDCSCWVRVAQSMAGRKYGSMAIPRIGQEVVVEFLEGDPDRPLVVGSVYNSDQMPHYHPPDHKTRTYFKTNSSQGGEGFNELMFEDLKGEEMVFVHAQRNMDVRVLNDSMETIHGNHYQIIGHAKNDKRDSSEDDAGDLRQLITRNKDINVLKDQTEQIDGHYQMAVGYGETESDKPGEMEFDIEKTWRISVGEDGLHTDVDGDENKRVGGSKSNKIDGDLIFQSGGSTSFQAGGDFISKGKNNSIEADLEVHCKGGHIVAVEGGNAVHIKGGGSVVVEAGACVSLKCGGNFITVCEAGIFIKGTLVGINSGGIALSGPGCSPISPLSPTEPDPVVTPEPIEPPESHDEVTGQKSNQ